MGKHLSFSLQNSKDVHPHMQLDEKNPPNATAFCKHLATDLLHWLLVYKYLLEGKSNGQSLGSAGFSSG